MVAMGVRGRWAARSFGLLLLILVGASQAQVPPPAETAWAAGRWDEFLNQQFAGPAAGLADSPPTALARAMVAAWLLDREALPEAWTAGAARLLGPLADQAGLLLAALRKGDAGLVEYAFANPGSEPLKALGRVLTQVSTRPGLPRDAAATAFLCESLDWLINIPPGPDPFFARLDKLSPKVIGLVTDQVKACAEATRIRVEARLVIALRENRMTSANWLPLVVALGRDDQAKLRMGQVLSGAQNKAFGRAVALDLMAHASTAAMALSAARLLTQAGLAADAVATLRELEQKSAYPDRRAYRRTLYGMLGGLQAVGPLAPWRATQPGAPATVPPQVKPFHDEYKVRLAAAQANPNDAEARFALADMGAGTANEPWVWQIHQYLAGNAGSLGLRASAWLAWAESQPREAFAYGETILPALRALPNEQGTVYFTLVGLATVAQGTPQQRAAVLEQVRPLWGTNTVIDSDLRPVVAQLAAALGRQDDALALLEPLAGSADTALRHMLMEFYVPNDAPPSEPLTQSVRVFLHDIGRLVPYRLSLAFAQAKMDQIMPLAMPNLLATFVNYAPQPEDAELRASRLALCEAMVARLGASTPEGAEATLKSLAFSLTAANAGRFGPLAIKLADQAVLRLGDRKTSAPDDLAKALAKYGIPWTPPAR